MDCMIAPLLCKSPVASLLRYVSGHNRCAGCDVPLKSHLIISLNTGYCHVTRSRQTSPALLFVYQSFIRHFITIENIPLIWTSLLSQLYLNKIGICYDLAHVLTVLAYHHVSWSNQCVWATLLINIHTINYLYSSECQLNCGAHVNKHKTDTYLDCLHVPWSNQCVWAKLLINIHTIN